VINQLYRSVRNIDNVDVYVVEIVRYQPEQIFKIGIRLFLLE